MKALSTDLAISTEALTAGVFALGEAYAVNVGKRTFEVYEQALAGHMTEAEFRGAVAHALETEERWCSPATLIRIVRQLREDRRAEGPTEEEIALSEAEADRAAQEIGS